MEPPCIATTATQKTVMALRAKDWRGGRGAGRTSFPLPQALPKASGKVIPSLNGSSPAWPFPLGSNPDVRWWILTVNLERRRYAAIKAR